MIEIATHVTLFWNLSRNPDKISSKIDVKIRRKNTKFDTKNEKKSEIHFSFAKKMLTILAEILRLKNGAKECIV